MNKTQIRVNLENEIKEFLESGGIVAQIKSKKIPSTNRIYTKTNSKNVHESRGWNIVSADSNRKQSSGYGLPGTFAEERKWCS